MLVNTLACAGCLQPGLDSEPAPNRHQVGGTRALRPRAQEHDDDRTVLRVDFHRNAMAGFAGEARLL